MPNDTDLLAVPQEPHRPRAQLLTERLFTVMGRYMRIEAVGGAVLILAGIAALIWANSPAAEAYHRFWQLPLGISLGAFSIEHTLHFWVNDALMTVFFLAVGVEIRRELHEGALADLRASMLPLGAALGGVAVPALIYLAFNAEPIPHRGWAIPTATDIAFALGVLALLGRSIPGSVRIFLLTLAIVDDVIAVLIIALFYSGTLDYSGLILAAAGILMVMSFHSMGIGSAFAYIFPGALLWFGLLQTGAHPTLAGVVLGLMTPVLPARLRTRPLDMARHALDDIVGHIRRGSEDAHRLQASLRSLRLAQRELVAPVTRVHNALHPWVIYGVMPVFALANAGVALEHIDLSHAGALGVLLGVYFGLVIGKPAGVMAATWLMVRWAGCRLPDDMRWGDVALIGLLSGIGFTMSIFIAMLAFPDEQLIGAAKLGVLLASVTAAVLGLGLGVVRRGAAKGTT